MKRTIFTAVLLTFQSLIFGQTIPNNDFENGADSTSATSWQTINDVAPSTEGFNRVSDSFSGNYAAKLKTFDFFGNTIPGIATLGEVQIGSVRGGIAFPHRPNKLTGYYKHPGTQDNSLIWVYFIKNNGGSVDTIGQGIFTPSGNITQYTAFEINIAYTNSDTPDSMNIVLLSDENLVGSELYVDKLTFDYASSTTEELEFQKNIKVYPNPSNGIFNISNKNQQSTTNLKIINTLGKVIRSQELSLKNNQINISKEPEGIYFLQITNSQNHIITKKIIKK